MNLLYKYYSNESEYAFENLKNGEICFTPLEMLNDPFEGVGKCIYEVDEREQKYWDAIGVDLPKLLADRTTEDYRDALNFKCRVFCSSKECNNALLWAHYANSHRGFCVGYEEKNIANISDELVDITYSENMCSVNELDEFTLIDLLKMKSIKWQYENEKRALYILKDEDVNHQNAEMYYDNKLHEKDKMYKLHGYAQCNNLEMLCVDKYILKKCKPTVIYLGLNMEENDKCRIINIAQNYSARVFQMVQDNNTFSLSSYECK